MEVNLNTKIYKKKLADKKNLRASGSNDFSILSGLQARLPAYPLPKGLVPFRAQIGEGLGMGEYQPKR